VGVYTGFYLLRGRLVNTVLNLWVAERREFIDQLNDHQLLKKDSCSTELHMCVPVCEIPTLIRS